MQATDYLNLLLRSMHIISAITAVGGTIFVRLVVVPAQSVLTTEQQASLHTAMRSRWSKILSGAILILIVSGLYNFFMTITHYTLPKWYHPLFGVKFLLAMSIFAIGSLLAGRTSLAEKMRRNARFWLTVNILLAIGVVCVSGVLRSAQRIEKAPTVAPTTLDADR